MESYLDNFNFYIILIDIFKMKQKNDNARLINGLLILILVISLVAGIVLLNKSAEKTYQERIEECKEKAIGKTNLSIVRSMIYCKLEGYTCKCTVPYLAHSYQGEE